MAEHVRHRSQLHLLRLVELALSGTYHPGNHHIIYRRTAARTLPRAAAGAAMGLRGEHSRQPRHPRHIQILQLLRLQHQRDLRLHGHRPRMGHTRPRAARRHIVLHLPDAGLHHRRLPRKNRTHARRSRFLCLRGLLPPARRRTHRACR